MSATCWRLLPQFMIGPMNNGKTPGELLRKVVAAEAIQIPGAHSALVGRLIEDCGFKAAYLSGAAFSAGVMGLPDVGLFTLTELVQHVEYITSRVSIPVVVDADTGFGGTVQVERTVELLERAGAAAIQIEDQQLPKRCGHLSGKMLVETDQMCAKLRAARLARSDASTVIIARTDANGVEGFDAAIERAKAYVAAGADWIFPEALTTREEFAAFAKAVDVPLMANMTEFGKSPLLPFEELAAMGYRAVIYPVTLLRVAMKAMETALAVLASDGSQQELLELMQTRQELYELIDYDGFAERDRQHFN